MTQPILVGSDLMPESDRAIARAVQLAASRQAPLVALHILDQGLPASVRDAAAVAAHDQIANLLKDECRLQSATVEWRVEVLSGDPFAELVAATERMSACAIVLGMHRKQGMRELIAGTTSARVLRTSDRPVWIAARTSREPARKVLAAFDFSPPAQVALESAIKLTEIRELLVLHAFDTPFAGLIRDPAFSEQWQSDLQFKVEKRFAEVWKAVGSTGLEPQLRLERGPFSTVLMRVMGAWQPDLVCLGSHGRGLLARLLLGHSVIELLDSPPCDLLISRG